MILLPTLIKPFYLPGLFAPSFGQSRGVLQLGQNTNTVGSNEEEDGGELVPFKRRVSEYRIGIIV